jgi:hypothetical protein
MERAKVLFGCYRRGDANDPEQYVASIAAVLTIYDPELIRIVTDPRTGISTSEKFATFMPNSGELKIYCDDLAAKRWQAKQQRRAFIQRDPKPLEKKAPGTSYFEMFEKHGRPIGRFEQAGDKWNR